MSKAILVNVNEYFNMLKEDVKKHYEYNKQLLETIKGKANKENEKLIKNSIRMSAGIYNKDLKLYMNAYNKASDIMLEVLEMMAQASSPITALKVDFHTEETSINENEQAYLDTANFFKDELEKIKERHSLLMNYGYFN